MASFARSARGAALVAAVVGTAALAPVGFAAADDAIDLHHVNWQTAQLPGRVCGLRHPVHLRRGKARVSRRLEVNAGWHRVVYGDLDGDGRDEAGVSVACTNGGGTADSVLSYAVVVFRAGARPASIGILRPLHHASGALPTLLEVDIVRSRIVGREAFYGPRDGTCCPSGRARTVWRFRNGSLLVATSRVTKKPD